MLSYNAGSKNTVIFDIAKFRKLCDIWYAGCRE